MEENILKAGFFSANGLNDIPNYRQRYDFFVEEFIKYNLEIPEELEKEYYLLFKMFGEDDFNDSIQKKLSKYKVNISDEIPMPEIVLSFCDENGDNKRMVMTRQNISSITARAKVGKTFLVKLIVGAVLKKGVFQNRLNSELPSGRDKILYIDTEQSKYHVKLGLSQIYSLLGDEYKDEINRLDVYQFDSVGTMQRLEFVKWLIYNNNYDLVIIDGISDLSLDTNNLKDADELVTNLRIWATEKDLHIVNIIHQNPSDLSDKMKGHLGTKLTDKSEIVIGISIDKENENSRIVQSLASRNRRPEPFQFTILESGIPEISSERITTDKINGKRASKTEKPDFELFQILTSLYSKNKESLFFRYGQLINGISYEYELKYNTPIGDTMTRKLLMKFIDNNWILKSGEEKFTQYFLGSFNQNEYENSDENDNIF